MSTSLSHQRLPWTNVRSEQALFRAALIGVFALFLLIAITVSFYTVPEKDREAQDELPPQLAKLLKESRAKKVEPKKLEKPIEQKPKVEPLKPKDPVKVAPKPKPKPTPKETVRKPRELKETKKSTAKQIEQAREVAKQSGILAMQSEMSALSNTVSSSAFTSSASQKAATGKARSVETTNQSAINATSSAQASTEQVLSSTDDTLADAQAEKLEARQEELDLAKAERSARDTRKEDDIQIVVEGLRSTFNLLYNRALRDDPFLEGILVLKIRIEASGAVSKVDIVESTIENDAFVAKLIARLKLTNFGASGNEPVDKTLPFEFTPS